MPLADTNVGVGTTGTASQTTPTYQNHNTQLVKTSGGLLQNQSTSAIPTAATQTQSVSSRPIQYKAPSESSMVANQMTGLLATNSPYMQQARLNAERASAARGLNNSSMAVQAGEQAAIASSLPIAQQDAGTHATFESDHNKYNQTWSLSDQSYNQQRGLANLNADLADRRDANQFSYSKQLADQSYGHQTGLADQAYGHQTGLNEQQYTQQQGLAEQAFGHQQGLNEQQFGHEMNMDDKRFDNQIALNEQQFGQQKDLNAQEFDQQTQLNDQQLKNNLTMQNDSQMHEADFQKLKGQQELDLANVNAEHAQTLETNKSAAALYASYQQAVAQIMQDPKMSPDKARTAVNTLKASMEASLDLIGGIAGLELGGSGSTSGGSTSGGSLLPKSDPRNDPSSGGSYSGAYSGPDPKTDLNLK